MRPFSCWTYRRQTGGQDTPFLIVGGAMWVKWQGRPANKSQQMTNTDAGSWGLKSLRLTSMIALFPKYGYNEREREAVWGYACRVALYGLPRIREWEPGLKDAGRKQKLKQSFSVWRLSESCSLDPNYSLLPDRWPPRFRTKKKLF